MRGFPVIVNEFFWSLGFTLMMQCYSTRGLDVVAALNVSSTVNNLFSIIYLSLGSSIAIIMGNLLGASRTEEAIDSNRKLIAFSVFSSLLTAIVLISLSPVIPKLFKLSDEVDALATFMLITIAVIAPFSSFAYSSYFTLRSGGRVYITMLLDSGFMWGVALAINFSLSRFTSLNIFWLYPICQSLDILKSIFAAILLKKVKWAQNIVAIDNK